MLELYYQSRHSDCGDLGFMTKDAVKTLVYAISLDWVDCDHSKWYNKPRPKDDAIVEICVKNHYDLFSLVADRLSTMDLTNNSNIPLAVLLTELLSKDKPNKDENDYHEIREWENSFNRHLLGLWNDSANNKRLLTLLWAVYSQTKATMDGLSEIMTYLPPYLQIRSVKKLFQLMALGKIHHTAESLYKIVKNGNGQICLPLEIVFAYLKLRENDPNATLTNETMLQLIDGREDHNEWIGVRNMVTQCVGRIAVRHERDDRRMSWGNDY